MAAAITGRKTRRGWMPVVGIALLLFLSLFLLGEATSNSDRFGDLYGWILLVNAAMLLVLVSLIGMNLFALARQYRAREAGSRLTMRLVVIFVLIAVIPVTVVYAFSMQFLLRGMDSWFDVRIEQGLSNALELSQASLDLKQRDLLKHTRELAKTLSDVSDSRAVNSLHDLRSEQDTMEMTLLGKGNLIIAFSSSETTAVVPRLLDDTLMSQVKQAGSYVALEQIADAGLHVRVVVPVPIGSNEPEARYLHALYPIPRRLNDLADSVQEYYAVYQKLVYLRKPLKNTFSLTLSIVLLLSLFAAIWAAFYSARRLVEPISDLAEGTRDVANGDYDKQLPMRGHDELGFLVASFNQMTRRISRARDQAQLSQQQAEEQRAYLETVLAHLSSGVLTLDQDGTVRSANSAAQEILNVDLSLCIGESLEAVAEIYPHIKRFVDMVMNYLHDQAPEWRDETVLFGRAGRQVLILHGTRLQVETIQSGDFVLVFDDVTTLVQAQRDAAWGEVARRLAHEIKNPLTPIQLSAERLRHKFLDSMDEDAAKVLDRATHTIVQQVESMKEMVNAFSEYARAPQIRLERLRINSLIKEVCELYRAATSPADIHLELDSKDPVVEADSGRLRQLFHNLIKNAQEASEGKTLVRIDISTRCMDEHGCDYCEIMVRDYGEGFPEDALGQYFEPYVTTKPGGTGLGLAIVKKIVEEHGGMIWIENVRTEESADAQGAQVQVRLPVVSAVTAKAEDSHVE